MISLSFFYFLKSSKVRYLTLLSKISGYELMRPYLHEFLTSAYEDYDIVIWSATGMKWIEEKMRLLGVSTHQDYKIMFYLDYLAMITVHTAKYGTIDVSYVSFFLIKMP